MSGRAHRGFALAPALALLAACGSGGAPAAAPTAAAAAAPHSCGMVSGAFRFAGLASDCARRGALSQLPVYPIEAGGRLRGPRDRRDFLPLPLGRWADPGTVDIEQEGCAKLTVSLGAADGSGGAAPYLVYELPMAELAAHGRLAWDAHALTFEGTGSWEGWQLPLGISRRRESWSLARDETGRLRYTFASREASAVFWVIPARRTLTLDCRLPPVSAAASD